MIGRVPPVDPKLAVEALREAIATVDLLDASDDRATVEAALFTLSEQATVVLELIDGGQL